jgi:hypothetical protein
MRNDTLTDARLRELYRRGFAERGPGKRERCVELEALLAVLRREGPEDERLRVLDHVMACPACRAEFDLLRSIEQAGAETEAPVLRRLFPRRAWRVAAPLALAASVALVVTVRQRQGGREAPDVARGAAESVVLLEPGERVPVGAPISFRWQPVPGARHYQLEVLDGRGNVVFAESTEQTSVTLRDPGRLSPDATYRWWVRAGGGSGEERASPLRSLRVQTK